ncbi:MAG: IclR family transcriptional regulator [Planctomycetaceae bacterium]|jgi:IclR family transcriptional regulator, KDG regulon repressor|nr:IclR family transcriptional regulator [Planctomycetaceae bacterium]
MAGVSEPKTVLAPALERGMRILECLSAKPQGATLAEISAALEAPKNSMLRLLQTLVDCEYVIREESPPHYLLTEKLLRISHPHVREVSLVECSLDAMRRLRDQVGRTVQLGIPTGDEGVIIEKLESKAAIRIGVEIGLRFRLHNTAPGKLFLAFRPETERQATIKRIKLDRFTSRTITNRSDLKKKCEQIVSQGYSADWGEADEGINCLAAPICDQSGSLIAAIWVSDIAGQMPKEAFPEVGKEVVSAAQEIERRIKR